MTDALRAEIRRLAAEGDREREADQAWQLRYEEYLQKQRGTVDQIVYKTFDPTTRPTTTTRKSFEDSREWNKWWLECFNEEFCKRLRPAIAKHVQEEIRALEVQMRAEITKAVANVRFPQVKGWTSGLHKRGTVVIYQGSTFQCTCDTTRRPGHSDWNVLAACGLDGGLDYGDDQRGVIDLPDWRERRRGNVA